MTFQFFKGEYIMNSFTLMGKLVLLKIDANEIVKYNVSCSNDSAQRFLDVNSIFHIILRLQRKHTEYQIYTILIILDGLNE